MFYVFCFFSKPPTSNTEYFYVVSLWFLFFYIVFTEAILARKQEGHALPQISFCSDGWTDKHKGKGYNSIDCSFWEDDGITIGGFNLGMMEWEASYAAAIDNLGIENDDGIVYNPLDDDFNPDDYDWDVVDDDIMIATPKKGANLGLVFLNCVNIQIKT